MNLADIQSLVLPGEIAFFINGSGEITCDQQYHLLLFQTYIVQNWDRFSQCVSTEKLWDTLRELPSTVFLRFTLEGECIEPPASIAHLLDMEQKRKFVSHMLERRIGAVQAIVWIVLIIFLVFVQGVVRDLSWAYRIFTVGEKVDLDPE